MGRRWEHVIFVVDRNGNLVDEWPQHDKLFGQLPCGRGPHTIKMSPYDPDKHVWVIDDQLHVIYRFTYDGKLEFTLGQLGVRGRGPNTFDRPTDIAWLPDGTYFISDGYGGTRVAKFDRNDKFLMDWGSAPKDPANPGLRIQYAAQRCHQRGSSGFVVADRMRSLTRMEVLDMWPLRSPTWPTDIGTLVTNHIITADGFIWAGDAGTNRILKYDLNGNFLYSWGAPGPQPGRLNCPHGLSTDQERNLYIADCFGGRVQKFAPQPNPDPAKLVGRNIAATPEPAGNQLLITARMTRITRIKEERNRLLVPHPRNPWSFGDSDYSSTKFAVQNFIYSVSAGFRPAACVSPRPRRCQWAHS
jgi:DNA-binding beta-propeller fold protein YncE